MPARHPEARDYGRIGRQFARALRLELDLGFAPIGGPQLWEIIRERGIDLAFHEFGEKGGDGLYLWNGSRGLIVLNTSITEPLRVRFTAAHELGHHEIHRHEMPLIYTDRDVLAVDRGAQKEAHAFASELLLPEVVLRKEIATLKPIELIDIVHMMRTYGVSYDSLIWRLGAIGFLDESDSARLDAARPDITNLEDVIGVDESVLWAPPSQPLPEEFVLNALRLFQEEAYSEERLAELLRTDVADVLERAKEVPPHSPAMTPEIEALLNGP